MIRETAGAGHEVAPKSGSDNRLVQPISWVAPKGPNFVGCCWVKYDQMFFNSLLALIYQCQ